MFTKRLVMITALCLALGHGATTYSALSARASISGKISAIPSWIKNNVTPQKALLVGAAVTGAFLVGAYAYNQFFKLSDAQAIENALTQCNQITFFNNNIYCKYQNEFDVLNYYKNSTYNKYAYIFFEIKSSIYAHNFNRPFTSYVKSLDNTIYEINGKLKKLSKARTNLLERLAVIHTQKEAVMNQEALLNNFEDALAATADVYEQLQDTALNLNELRNVVLQSTEYTLELQDIRIQELEEKDKADSRDDKVLVPVAVWTAPTTTTFNVTNNNFGKDVKPVEVAPVASAAAASVASGYVKPVIKEVQQSSSFLSEGNSDFGVAGNAWWGA